MTELLLRAKRGNIMPLCFLLLLLGALESKAWELARADTPSVQDSTLPIQSTVTTEQLNALVDARIAAALPVTNGATRTPGVAENRVAVDVPARSLAVTGQTPPQLNWIQYLLVFSPILLHLLVLFWIRSSKMSLKEALGDKEELNREANRVQMSLAQAANRSHALRSQALNTVLAQPLSHLITQPVVVAAPGLAPGGPVPMAQPAADLTLLQDAAAADIAVRQQIVNYIFDASRGQVPSPIAVGARPARIGAEGLADAVADANPPVTSTDNSPPLVTSVSRLIVFVSGYAGISISTALASFMIYKGIAEPGDNLPDLNGLLLLMLSLGIGVVPYAVNRITASSQATATTTGG